MTRGCIAIGNLTQWQGILIPSDAHPHKVGVEIRNYLKHNRDLFAFANELLTHPTWTSFKSKHVGGRDPFVGITNSRLTHRSVNPLYITYVYVIDPEVKALHRFDYKTTDVGCGHQHAVTIDLITDDPPLLSMRPKEILDLRFRPDEEAYKHGSTVRAYLTAILTTLWAQQEGFNSKRPFGRGGWNFDICVVLIRNGIVKGELDPYGRVGDIEEKAALTLIGSAIKTLLEGD